MPPRPSAIVGPGTLVRFPRIAVQLDSRCSTCLVNVTFTGTTLRTPDAIHQWLSVTHLCRLMVVSTVQHVTEPETTWQPDLHLVSTVVYAERGDQILLLKRAMGFLTGQWFLPGGALDAGEPPVDGARRELKEEAGLEIEGDLELVGVYWSQADQGHGQVFISYRGRVADGEVQLSREHDGVRWVDPAQMRATFTDEFVDALAQGDPRLGGLIQAIRDDLDEYLLRRPRA